MGDLPVIAWDANGPGMAKVLDGVLEGIYALTDSGAGSILGPSRGKADIVIVRDDGSFWPREDWYDIPLVYVC